MNGRELLKNGVILKVIIAALGGGLVVASGGIIKLYRDVGVLQSTADSKIENERRLMELKKEIGDLRVVVEAINAVRYERGSVLQEHTRRIENLERGHR